MALDFTKATGNKALSAVAKTSQYNSARTEVYEIPLDQIDENIDNDKIFNMEGIDFLAKTIDREGWTGAIEVIALPNGRYEITSGHRRYRAMKQLGKTTIPCIISHNVDARTKARKLISSNVRNRELTPLDWGRAIQYFAENVSEQGEINAESRRECVEFFGFTGSKISRYLALTKLAPSLQHYAATEGFPVSALSPASRLSVEEQNLLAKKIDEQVEEIKRRAIEENGDSGEEPTIDYSLISKGFVTQEVNKLRGGAQQRVLTAKKARVLPKSEPIPVKQTVMGAMPDKVPDIQYPPKRIDYSPSRVHHAEPMEIGEQLLSYLHLIDNKKDIGTKMQDILVQIRDEINRLC